MKLTVIVKTRAKETKVEQIKDGVLRVAVKAVPHAGQANTEVVKAVAKYLGVAPARVRIRLGKTRKEKLLEVT